MFICGLYDTTKRIYFLTSNNRIMSIVTDMKGSKCSSRPRNMSEIVINGKKVCTARI